MTAEKTILLNVKNVKKHFPVTRGIVFQKQIGTLKAVDGISFDVFKGETLGLVERADVVSLPLLAPFCSYTGPHQVR